MSKIVLTKGKFSDEGHISKSCECPHCGTLSLDYGALQVVDESIFYPWTCFNCEKTGEEWHKLVFISHTIDNGK